MVSRACSGFELSQWAAALNLRERAAIFQSHRNSLKDSAFNPKTSAHYLKKWRQQAPFDQEGILEQRLAADGITPEDFEILLGLDPKALAEWAEQMPPWLQTLREAYAAFETSKPFPQERLRANPGVSFCYFIQPLTDYVIALLHNDIQDLLAENPEFPIDGQNGIRLFLEPLYFLLMRTMNKTLILELNIERLENMLKGDTPEARFENFTQKLRNPEYSLRILREYPVLARTLAGIAMRWREARLEFLKRLSVDWPAICSTFFAGNHPGKLISVFDSGDRHCNGRAVAILTFESGQKLVYKPRSLGIDEQYYRILTWLNIQCDWNFEPMKVINQGDYGWVEFIEQKPCTSTAEVGRFYQRLGGLLAVLYVLEASDFHYENLIASGDMPQLIDLESFFTPYFASKGESWMSIMGKSMVDSVLQTGLLPWRIFLGKKDQQGLDISGVTNAKGMESNQYAPSWNNEGADDMHLVFHKHALKEGKNRPILNGNDVSLLEYEADFLKGFSAIYQILLANREKLLNESGLVLGANHENRVLTRMTLGYSYLLNQSYHPDKLRNGLDQELHWDGLWMGIERQPLIPRFFKGEREALEQADIPVFTGNLQSKDLHWPNGGCEKDFFQGTSLQRVFAKLERLSDEDLQTQIWFIRGSLATLRAEHSEEIPYVLTIPDVPATSPDLMKAVYSVSNRLEDQVKEQHGESSWINLCLLGESGYHLQPMSIDLYSGLPGMAMFYGYLGKVSGNETYGNRAKSIIRGLNTYLAIMRERSADVREGPDYGVGMFQGYGGIIYTLTHAATLWADATLLEAIEGLVPWIAPLVECDEKNDIVSGNAGLLLAMLSLHCLDHKEESLSLALRCGERLLHRAHRERGGLCWKGSSGIALTGFSHGASGIAYALLRLGAVSGDARFTHAGKEALNFERSHFLPTSGNWADMRKLDLHLPQADTGDRPLMCAWCNGASGIGLSRLLIRNLIEDSELDDELEIALKTTLAKGFGKNHSLCHGDVGNLEFLSKAAEFDSFSHLKHHADCIANAILSSIDEHGWICGVPNHFEALGLMTGITGIGYGLMRHTHPDMVPSILMLEPPNVQESNLASPNQRAFSKVST